MKIISTSLIFGLLMIVKNPTQAQTNLYHPSEIQQIEIFFSNSNWDFQMDTAKAGAEGFISLP